MTFNAKVDANSATTTDTTVQTNSNEQVTRGWWWWTRPVSQTVSYSNTRTVESGTYSDSYSLNIKLVGVQDEIPGGMRRVLNLLESAFVPYTNSTPI